MNISFELMSLSNTYIVKVAAGTRLSVVEPVFCVRVFKPPIFCKIGLA